MNLVGCSRKGICTRWKALPYQCGARSVKGHVATWRRDGLTRRFEGLVEFEDLEVGRQLPWQLAIAVAGSNESCNHGPRKEEEDIRAKDLVERRSSTTQQQLSLYLGVVLSI
ncbi:hypothetical protein CsSME_00011080 [Camellia sinensis var. sinensis]